MSQFKVHTIESAPSEAQPILKAMKGSLGFVPNLMGVLSNAPVALSAYVSLVDLLDKSSLTPAERQIALLAVSTENSCAYCVAAHSVIAKNMVKVDAATVAALRDGKSLPDAKQDALAKFVQSVVKNRGVVGASEVEGFLSKGYTQQNVLEVLVAVSAKTLSNYVNHIAATPLDAAFQPEAWSR